MEAHIKRLLYELNWFRAFIIAALKVSEQFRKFLEEKVRKAEGRLKKILTAFLSDVLYWLDVLKEELIPSTVLMAKRIGVVVKSFEEGWIKDDAVIFKLLQQVRTIMEKARRLCLCALGYKQFEKVENFAKELLKNPEVIQEKEDELFELSAILKELDEKLEEHLMDLDKRKKELSEEVV